MRLSFAGIAGEADQDDAGWICLADKDQPAEVFVLSEEDTSFLCSLRDEFAVVGAMRHFTHGKDIVASGP